MAELENKMIMVRHPCSLCARDNRHVVLYSHTETQHEFYEEEIYQIVKCGGCESISFRKVVRDYQQATPLEDGEWYVPEKVSCYPNILKNYRELQEEWMLPDAVREIYTQSIEAIKSNSNVLAGMGLRATIEAICNDCSIAGKSLEKRIEVLGMRPITSNTNLSTPCATRTGAPTTALRTCPAPHRPNSLLVDEASLQGEPGIAKLT